MKRMIVPVIVLLAAQSLSGFAQTITTIAEINSIDAVGNPTFPGLNSTDRYTIEGLAINEPGVFNGEGDSSYILFMQDDTGGIQVYSGAWYGGGLGAYPAVQPGDRLRVTGLTGHFGGKTNVNERHNPDQKFEMTVLSTGNTLNPFPIHDLAAATAFDPTRQTGGEYYQGRLVAIHNVEIVEGEWTNGSVLTVQDSHGGQMNVELRFAAGIANHPQPTGPMTILGVFDQEDTEAPYQEGYVLWPRSIADFQSSSGMNDWCLYR